MSTKDNEYDALGQRMKRYEEVANGQLLIPELPLYARIDGRHFSKLTKNLGYPFKDLPAEKRSYVFAQLMQLTAHGLMEEFKCDIAETHSDEISLGWKNIKTAPFDGKYFKLVSNIASYAGMLFERNISIFYEGRDNITFSDTELEDVKKLSEARPSFDCRIVQLPDLMELTNCFVWRQNDCIRGAINQYAQRWFTHKELLGKSQDERIEMLSNAGHHLMDIDTSVLYGYWLVKRTSVEKIDPKYKKFHPEEETMVRTKVVKLDLNYRFADDLDKVGTLFPEKKEV